jgi:hypothetical protein
MSAFLSSCDALSALATYWFESIQRRPYTNPTDQLTTAILTSNPGATPYLKAKATADALLNGRPAAAVIFELLLTENQASLEARYPGDLEYRSAAGYRFTPDPDVQRAVIRNRTGWIVGILDGFEYQASEHDGWHHSIARALCLQMRRCFSDDLRRLQDPAGEQDLWASYSRGEAPPVTSLPV